ncbi:MAG: hypothetical protein VBE63_23890 [Lamprobacter sp.]|nr:hypothetical protein [Lamprobacter sp.]MEA3642958.1 hypothetical protein [Lamprobacter sp.]
MPSSAALFRSRTGHLWQLVLSHPGGRSETYRDRLAHRDHIER